MIKKTFKEVQTGELFAWLSDNAICTYLKIDDNNLLFLSTLDGPIYIDYIPSEQLMDTDVVLYDGFDLSERVKEHTESMRYVIDNLM